MTLLRSKPFVQLSALLLIVSASAGASAQGRTYLNIGDPAPAMRPAKWLKGKPAPTFEKGKIYVVEFWATWCTPCKANIPVLTALAKQYAGKVSVIGVDVMESSDPTIVTLPKVEAFVKSQGDRMDYLVAADGPDARIEKDWLKKAGEGGLPVSFIVGRDGKIAWIGYPTKLEESLAQIVDDKFDVAAARARRAVEVEVTRPIEEAMQDKEWKKVLDLTDAEIARKPDSERRYGYQRFIARFHVDVPEAKVQAEALLHETSGDIGIYQMLASIFASSKDLAPDTYRYGATLIDEALAKKDREYLFLAMRSEVDMSLGDKAAAIRHQQAAVAAAKIDSHAPAEFVLMLQKKLDALLAGKPTAQ